MSRWRVLVLLHKDLIPPNKIESKEQWAEADWKTEYDVVNALKKLKHEVKVLGVGEELVPIRAAIEEFQPKIVFNLLEEFAGEAVYDQNVVSYLELLGVKYTGATPRGLMLARDKALAKKVLMYHRIPTPRFWVFRKNLRIQIRKNLPYPLFVKTLNEEASLGISQKSVVYDEAQLLERVKHLHEKFETDVLVERYIEGREFYVGCYGNQRVTVLPVWELVFENMSDKAEKIATNKVKWDFKYRKKHGIKSAAASGLDADIEKKILNVSRRAYKALELSGYARMDLRVTESGEVFIIEANPNPDIGDQEDLSSAAHAAGIKYKNLIQKILTLGLKN